MQVVRELLDRGARPEVVSAETGVPLGTLKRWGRGATKAFGPQVVVERSPWRPRDRLAYAYLLGMYLGDGCVNPQRFGKRGRPRQVGLTISLDAAYPRVVEECRAAMAATMPTHRIAVHDHRPGKRMMDVKSTAIAWLEAFPQHGPGRKHLRPIVLDAWQQEIVDEAPERFVRGLIHSDGCRCVNRFTTKLPSGRVAEYAYPRYFFSNLSSDIRGLFCASCDALGIRWTMSNPRNVSISHRPSVAILEDIVGPKR